VSTGLAAALTATDEEVAAVEARRSQREHRVTADARSLAAARRPDGAREVYSVAAELLCPDPEVIRPVVRDAVGADAEITQLDGGLAVLAAMTGRDPEDAYRRLAAPASKAAPSMTIIALVRDPSGELTEFDNFALRLGSAHRDWRNRRDPVLEGAHFDARQALAAELPASYLDCDQAEELLGRLADEQLAQPVSEDRYRIHDLLRVFARDVFDQDDEETPEWIATRTTLASLESAMKASETFSAAVAQAGGVTMSPVEVARRYLRICETADRLGVREWTRDGSAPASSAAGLAIPEIKGLTPGDVKAAKERFRRLTKANQSDSGDLL
jgi:hypothetical protein